MDEAQARHCIGTYIRAWNEHVADQRRRLLAAAMTDEATYCDPSMLLAGPAALVAHIGAVLAKYRDARIVRTSELDLHHQAGRFNWQLVKADGKRSAENVDFVEFAEDGRIRSVTGFFGTLPPNVVA